MNDAVNHMAIPFRGYGRHRTPPICIYIGGKVRNKVGDTAAVFTEACYKRGHSASQERSLEWDLTPDLRKDDQH